MAYHVRSPIPKPAALLAPIARRINATELDRFGAEHGRIPPPLANLVRCAKGGLIIPRPDQFISPTQWPDDCSNLIWVRAHNPALHPNKWPGIAGAFSVHELHVCARCPDDDVVYYAFLYALIEATKNHPFVTGIECAPRHVDTWEALADSMMAPQTPLAVWHSRHGLGSGAGRPHAY